MMYRPTIHTNYPYEYNSNFEYEKKIEIYIDTFISEDIPEDTIRIIIIQEPLSAQWVVDKVRNRNNDKFYSYVFTYHQDILKSNEKAVYYLCTTTWIKDYDFPSKKFAVSTLVGGKTNPALEGYGMRHELWSRQWEINIFKNFYLSSNYKYDKADYINKLVLGENLKDKHVMFNNQYHIAIENTSMLNTFSEKLLDCFQTKTIPIHYGTPNIGDYFNVEGILIIKNVNEIINICNVLTPEYYNNQLTAIEENYQKSMNYLSTTEILDKKLKEILK